MINNGSIYLGLGDLGRVFYVRNATVLKEDCAYVQSDPSSRNELTCDDQT